MIFAFLLSFIISIVSAEVNIELKVKERANINRQNDIVSFGVPIKSDFAVLDENSLGVFDSSGNIIPTQFKVLSRYHGLVDDQTVPIRVILLQFQISILPSVEDKYYLRTTQINVPAGSDSLGLISETSTHFKINTGELEIEVSKTKFNLFDSVKVGSENFVLNSNLDDGIIIENDGKTYSSTYSNTTYSIEENGSIVGILKIEGYFASAQGETLLPICDPTKYYQGGAPHNPLKFTVRMKVFKNSKSVKVDVTLKNENQGWSYHNIDHVHNAFIDVFRIQNTLEFANNKFIEIGDLDSDNITTTSFEDQEIILSQIHQEITRSEENNFEFILNKGNQEISTGKRFDGYFSVRDNSKTIVVSSRWFWQNYPKSIGIESKKMNFYLLPNTGTKHKITGGIWKTHELIFNFDTLSTKEQKKQVIATLKKPLIALASPEYISESDFFVPTPPPMNNIRTNHFFKLNESLDHAFQNFDRRMLARYFTEYSQTNQKHTYFTVREARSNSDHNSNPINMYGWYFFGDLSRGDNTWGYSGLHYDHSFIALNNFLRYQNDAWKLFDFGEELVTHHADILIIHDPDSKYPDRLYHGAHRYESDALLTVNGNFHAPGNNAPKSFSHFFVKGVMLKYLLSGDERYKDVINDMKSHLYYSVFEFMKCQTPTGLCKAGEFRQQGRGINGFTNLYKIEGNSTHLYNAYIYFKNGLLSMEGIEDNGEKGGWINTPFSTPNTLNICGTQCSTSLHYTAIICEPLVNLHTNLKEANYINEANEVRDFLLRMANWLKNDILTNNWEEGECGVYNSDGSQYRPYTIRKFWGKNFKWNKDDGTLNTDYAGGGFVDVIMFAYEETKDRSWLNLARNVFKDYMFYGVTKGIFQDTKIAQPNVQGFASTYLSSGSLKFEFSIQKPMYYLKKEYERSINPYDDNSELSAFEIVVLVFGILFALLIFTIIFGFFLAMIFYLSTKKTSQKTDGVELTKQ